MELCHYSSFKLTEILTLEEQWKRGIFFTEENETLKKYGYHKHVSLTIDKIPIQLIKDKFPTSSPFKRGGILYEHIIETDDIDNLIYFNIVETPFDIKIGEKWWNSSIRHKLGEKESLDYFYDYIRISIKSAINEKGTTIQSLNKGITKFKGGIENKYIDWVNSPTFDEESTRMYSPYIPHVMLHLNPGTLRVKSVKQVL